MKKAVVASLLAFASIVPGSLLVSAQTAGSTGQTGAAPAKVEMSAAEYNSYNNAITQTTPQAQAPALEAYLTAYPQSAVKVDTLQRLMLAYSAYDPAKTLDSADRLLQVDPNNIRALTFETYFRKASADQLTDPTAKQAPLDQAAGYAQKGLAATKPKEMTDDDFTKVMANAKPIFYSAIGTAALNKKDTAAAISAFQSELSSVPVAQTTTPGPVLQDTYFLGLAYLQSTPPDLINCTFYVSRFVAYAPAPYNTQMLPTAQYCYKKYHGDLTGYEAVTAAAKANLMAPADFKITPAKNASDIASDTIKSTPDLATLALSDKEYILQNGKPEDAEKVWAVVKGKTVEIPGAVVISSTDSSIQAAVSDDAVQTKTADFTFNLKEPLKTPPVVGSKVTVVGTYASYTQNPIMITMSDSSEVKTATKGAAHAPAHRGAAPAHKGGGHRR